MSGYVGDLSRQQEEALAKVGAHTRLEHCGARPGGRVAAP